MLRFCLSVKKAICSVVSCCTTVAVGSLFVVHAAFRDELNCERVIVKTVASRPPVVVLVKTPVFRLRVLIVASEKCFNKGSPVISC